MRRKIALFLILSMTLSLFGVVSKVEVKANGTIYYVDSVNGDDSHGGTSENDAWKSLDKVNSMTFLPGDKILFRADRVWNGQLWLKGSGVEGSPIVVDMYGTGNKPIINGQGTQTPADKSGAVMIVNEEYWEINNLEITNYSDSIVSQRSGILVYNGGDGIKNHIYISNCFVHDVNADKDGNKINGGIIIYSSTKDIYGKSTGVVSGYNDVRIENNHVKNVSIEGIRNKTEDGSDYPKVNTNIIIRNNFVEDVLGDGIVLAETLSGGRVEYNVVKNHSNTYVGNRNYAGCWVFTSHDAILQYNEVYGGKYGYNDGEAFDIDLWCDGTIYQYNYSHDNNGGFVLFMNGSTNSVFRYNLSVNDGQGNEIFHYGPSNSSEAPEIYNNTIYIGEGIDTAVFDCWSADNYAKFYNNIIESHGNVTFSNYEVNGQFYNNLIYPETVDNVNGPKTHLGLITENPRLVNPGPAGTGLTAAHDYKIQSDSPCINSGITVANNGGMDYFGNSLYNSDPDIGFHEFEGEVPPPKGSEKGLFHPSEDAYVRDGNYSDDNFGDDTGLFVKSDAEGYRRKAYMTFDYNSYEEPALSSAILRLYTIDVNTDSMRTIKIYGVDNENWSENSLTWNNAPSGSTLITEVEVDSTNNKWYDIDVTDYVQNHTDKRVSFLLINEGNESSKGDVTFASKESPYYKPELKLEKVNANFTPIDDTYVRDGIHSSTNFGADTGLMVKSDATDYGRKTYLKFDFNDYMDATVTQAKLRLYVVNVNTDPTRNIKLYGTLDESWDENQMTWSNAPIKDAYINTITINNVQDQWYEVDITDYLNEHMTDKVVSFVLINEEMESSKSDVTFGSKEHSYYQPKLVIE